MRPVAALLGDPRFSSARVDQFFAGIGEDLAEQAQIVHWFFSGRLNLIDAPQHTRLRKPMVRALSILSGLWPGYGLDRRLKQERAARTQSGGLFPQPYRRTPHQARRGPAQPARAGRRGRPDTYRAGTPISRSSTPPSSGSRVMTARPASSAGAVLADPGRFDITRLPGHCLGVGPGRCRPSSCPGGGARSSAGCSACRSP
jgi:hypothetical protein